MLTILAPCAALSSPSASALPTSAVTSRWPSWSRWWIYSQRLYTADIHGGYIHGSHDRHSHGHPQGALGPYLHKAKVGSGLGLRDFAVPVEGKEGAQRGDTTVTLVFMPECLEVQPVLARNLTMALQ